MVGDPGRGGSSQDLNGLLALQGKERSITMVASGRQRVSACMPVRRSTVPSPEDRRGGNTTPDGFEGESDT